MPFLVEIDAGKCQGHARCCDIAPELFDLDEIGDKARLNQAGLVDCDLAGQAARAAAACPESAISLTEEPPSAS